MTTGHEIGEFEEDGALDELGALIRWPAQRIQSSLSHPGFCGVDISAVRANMTMLATIIGQHGGGHLIQRIQVQQWAERMDEPFTNNKMWGFTPWSEDVKDEWRAGCRQTVQNLLDVLEE